MSFYHTFCYAYNRIDTGRCGGTTQTKLVEFPGLKDEEKILAVEV